jgi:hypothetical protein
MSRVTATRLGLRILPNNALVITLCAKIGPFRLPKAA